MMAYELNAIQCKHLQTTIVFVNFLYKYLFYFEKQMLWKISFLAMDPSREAQRSYRSLVLLHDAFSRSFPFFFFCFNF